MQYLLNGKTSIQTKQSPVIFVQQFSSLFEKNFQSVRQLSGNISEDFGKTACIVSLTNLYKQTSLVVYKYLLLSQ